jgi:predicted Zn-dependent protease
MELPPAACPPAAEVRPWQSQAPLLIEPGIHADNGLDYRHRLQTTAAGWPIRGHWCVWVEPVHASGPAAVWEKRWHQAVLSALGTWQAHLPITLVEDPQRAQVQVQRRRPPLLNNRASHGRALLQLQQVQRGESWQLEPQITVLISPGQAQTAIEATSLHELGHAFGLWGHSDQAGDVMAVHAGPKPVLQLSTRDQASLIWLQQQPPLQQTKP